MMDDCDGIDIASFELEYFRLSPSLASQPCMSMLDDTSDNLTLPSQLMSNACLISPSHQWIKA